MKVNKELLIELVSMTLGEDVLPLVEMLWKKSNYSEFKLAEKLNITVNQTRNMLYRLSELNLGSFMRKKDKKKGWYIYYWSLNKKSVINAVWKYKKKKLEDFRARLDREQQAVFYVCPSGCMRMTMDTAMEHDFMCQECGSLMSQQDNKRTVANVKRMIAELEKDVASYEAEKENIRLKIIAKRERLARAEERKKLAEIQKKKEAEERKKERERKAKEREKLKAQKERDKIKAAKEKEKKAKKLAREKEKKAKAAAKKKAKKVKKRVKKRVVKKKKSSKKKTSKKKVKKKVTKKKKKRVAKKKKVARKKKRK